MRPEEVHEAGVDTKVHHGKVCETAWNVFEVGEAVDLLSRALLR